MRQYGEATGLAEAVGPAYRSSVGGRRESKVSNMTVGDDDYGNAFKKAKLEHDERGQGDTEAKRLQAETDADIAVLSDVLLPQLQTAAQKLGPLGRQHRYSAVRSCRENATARIGWFPHNRRGRREHFQEVARGHFTVRRLERGLW